MDRIKQTIKMIMGKKLPKRIAPLVIVIVAALITFVTCAPWEAPAPKESAPDFLSEEPPEAPPPGAPGDDQEPGLDPEPGLESIGLVNPLTGLPTDKYLTNTRPLAIMINNAPDAQPQLGVSQADILYETLVEGGRTRMLAIYQDVSDVGVIGSIRSARPCYVDIAQSYDAVYIFAGASMEAYSILANRNITRLDGVNGRLTQIYYRDSQRARTMSFEHTLVTSGERIMRWLPTYDFRLEHEPGYERALLFAEDGAPSNGSPASDFVVRFSSGKSTTFSYREDSGRYYLGQFAGAYRDGNDNVQLSFTNVLILKTSINQIPGDSEGRLRIATTGSGVGYFACGGEYIEIEWSRDGEGSQFEYWLKDGSQLVLGQGKTYICIIPNNVNVDFT